MSLFDRFRTLERTQLIIYAVVGLLVLFIFYGLLTAGNDDPSTDQVDLEVPVGGAVQEYESKLEAYKEEQETKTNPIEIRFGDDLLDSSDSISDDDTASNESLLLLQRRLDSLKEAQSPSSKTAKNSTGGKSSKQATSSSSLNTSIMGSKEMTPEEELAYKELLIKSRDKQLSSSQDYSATKGKNGTSGSIPAVQVQASIFQDQFILPGDRVTLLLEEPLTYMKNTFPKNTYVYATATISNSRVLLSISNINHVSVALEARDIRDGEPGMYSERAGELWREYQAYTQSNAVNEITQEVSQNIDIPLVGSAVRGFGSFFKSKKYKDNDKILLMNNDQVLLTTKSDR